MKKCRHYLLYGDDITFFVTWKYKQNGKLMKIVNIGGENLHIFWTTWGNFSAKFSGKTWLMMILKATGNIRFILSLEDLFFKKLQRGGSNEPFQG